MWPFSKKEKDEPGVADKLVVGRMLMEMAIPTFYFEDGEYSLLSEKEARRFILKHHSKWHSDRKYKKETGDCDDFTKQAQSDLIDGQLKENFEAPFLFGAVKINKKDGTAHMLNVTVLKDGRMMFYEPQERKFSFELPEGATVERIHF